MSLRATVRRHHQPGSVWPIRRLGVYPQVYVRTADDDNIAIEFWRTKWHTREPLALSRKDARLLARRIVQCLEATK